MKFKLIVCLDKKGDYFCIRHFDSWGEISKQIVQVFSVEREICPDRKVSDFLKIEEEMKKEVREKADKMGIELKF